MQAIILAGGLGTRLRQKIYNIPKVMAPINHKPFLEYILEHLNKQGFKKVILAVGYKHEYIINYFGYRYKQIELIYSIEKKPLGTGGSVNKALKYLDDEYFFVINGDTLFKINFKDIKKPKNALIVCKFLNNTSRYGKVKVVENVIEEFLEKKDSKPGLINGGIYYLKKDLFKNRREDVNFSLEKDFFTNFSKKLKINVSISDKYFIDIGIPNDYERAKNEL